MSWSLAQQGALAGAFARVAIAGADRRQWALLWLTPAQQAVLVAIPVAVLLALLIWPGPTVIMLVGLMSVAYDIHLVFRATVWAAGAKPPPDFPLLRSDEDLPIYSIIVPLRHEANMAGKIVAALDALDYPADKLDVLFAVEADDSMTIEALRETDLPAWMRIAIVPASALPSKPRACNHALSFARGSFLVIFDAEDRPEPGQLKQAIAAFDVYGNDVACLQARLVPFNRDVSFWSRMFAIDYCQWFDGTLTGLQRLGCPIPLGGTSNHFRTRVLVESGAWDPYNVTEDADLGYRLARLGHQVRTINATTFEEAPVRFRHWFSQRTRWIKGYIQTLFVHWRSTEQSGLPPLGPMGWIGLNCFMAASVFFALVNPIFWALALYALLISSEQTDWMFGTHVAAMAEISFWAGNGLGVLIAVMAPIRRRWWGLVPWGLLVPLYWLPVSAAAYVAAAEFVRKPFRWRKTPHGVELAIRQPRPWGLATIATFSAAALCTGTTEGGAWAQDKGYGISIDHFGYAAGEDGQSRYLIEGYGEFGLGDRWTTIFLYEGDLTTDQSQYVWRVAGGVRRTFSIEDISDWVFSLEGTVRYQAHGGILEDPTFAGDGYGWSARADAGTSFELWERHAFADLSLGLVARPMAPDEIKLEAVAGLDLSETWQAGAGYFGSRAHGPFYAAGAYEKHEGQLWLRWRFTKAYAAQISVARTIATDRTQPETTFRIGLWAFREPQENDDD